MTPDGAARIDACLNSLARACRAIEQLSPDRCDELRASLRSIEEIVSRTSRVLDQENPPAEETPQLCCSFCGKAQAEVTKLIAGPSVFICNECVSLCSVIIAKEKKHLGGEPGAQGPAMDPSDNEPTGKATSYRRSVPPSKGKR
jgi:hypothetical protein